MENPFYQEQYETAPFEECRRYLRMSYCFSKCPDEPSRSEYAGELKKRRENLKADDLRHLIKYCGNNRARYEFRKLIEKLEK